jgi:hypothetical protein
MLVLVVSPTLTRHGVEMGTVAGFCVGVCVFAAGCAPRSPTNQTAWYTPPANVGNETFRRAPPPPITPEMDPDNVERRWGINEAKVRKEAARQAAPPDQTREELRLINAAAKIPPAPTVPPPPPVPAAPNPAGGTVRPDGGAPDAVVPPR